MEKNHVMGSLLYRILLGGKMEDNKMGGHVARMWQ